MFTNSFFWLYLNHDCDVCNKFDETCGIFVGLEKKPDPVNRNKEVCEMYIMTYVKDKTLLGTGG